MPKERKVLIVYNYIAHYRVPIFRMLSDSDEPLYTILSGTVSEIPIQLASTTVLDNGVNVIDGINWMSVKNIWFFDLFLWQRGLIKYVFDNEYNTYIFLGNMYYISTWISSILLRVRGKKVIFWTHGYLREENNFQGFVRKIFYKLANEILTYGHRAKNILVSKGFNASKINVVFNSMDYDFQMLIKEEVDKEDCVDVSNLENISFGFIGRVIKRKNISLLIDSLRLLHLSGVKANLIIIGDGDVIPDLKSQVIRFGLDDFVHFYGECYDERTIYRLLRKVKVVVSPGEVGLTAIHAMTYGIPVITHNRFDKQGPEFECIVPGVTGDFYDYNNPLDSLTFYLNVWLRKSDYEITKLNCMNMISDFYNPSSQKKVFDSVV